MDYRKLYLTLFNAQVDIIEDLEKIIGRLQIVHQTTEEMFVSAENEESDK